jgi:hypothetical protein
MNEIMKITTASNNKSLVDLYLANQTMTNFTNQTVDGEIRSLTSPFDYSPTIFEWCLIIIAILLFVIGLIGNLLVVIVVAKNSHMRTITNIFIVNLAIGDFLVILICLPPSLLNDITGHWWFGRAMCKLIVYIQVNFMMYFLFIYLIFATLLLL